MGTRLRSALMTWVLSRPRFLHSITPALGAELLADPGLEGTYTAGKVAALTKDGSPTLAQSADVHGGAKAQEFTATAQFTGVRYIFTPLADTFYRVSMWGKRSAGTSSKVRPSTSQSGTGNITGTEPFWTSSTYAQRIMTKLSVATSSLSVYGCDERGTSGFDTCIVDDFSAKALVFVSCFKTFMTSAALSSVSAHITSPTQPWIGVAANIDSRTNPLNCVLGLFSNDAAAARAVLYQVSNGVLTVKVSAIITYAADAELKVIQTAPTTYQLWYNGLQVGTDQTINDAAINNNTLFSQFSTYEGGTYSAFAVAPF